MDKAFNLCISCHICLKMRGVEINDLSSLMTGPSSCGFAPRFIPWHILLYEIHEVIVRPMTLALIMGNVNSCVGGLQLSWTGTCVTGGKHEISFGAVEKVPVVPFFLRLAGFKVAQVFMSEVFCL